MKYLKKWISIKESKNYYMEATNEEWDEFEPIDINTNFYNKICSLIDKSIYNIGLDLSEPEAPMIYIRAENGIQQLKIFASDDDWYWVYCRENSPAQRLGHVWREEQKFLLYKCDQPYGLIELLKDKNIIERNS